MLTCPTVPFSFLSSQDPKYCLYCSPNVLPVSSSSQKKCLLSGWSQGLGEELSTHRLVTGGDHCNGDRRHLQILMEQMAKGTYSLPPCLTFLQRVSDNSFSKSTFQSAVVRKMYGEWRLAEDWRIQGLKV